MKRLLIVLLALTLAMSWLPMKAAQAASLLKTDDGLEFQFGMAQKVQFHTISGLDFTDNPERNFRSLSVPDITIGNQPLSIWNFTNLLFTLSKGPVSVHANLEVEAAMDERVADVNHLNLERANLTWKTGVIGDLVVGFDVHLFDPEGGLIYQDEDPGIWLIGSNGPFSWNVGYHKRLQKNRGNQLGLGGVAAPFSIATNPANHDANIVEARVGFNLPVPGGNLSISPLFLYYGRHVPQGGTNPDDLAVGTVGNLAACPSGATGSPCTSGAFNPNVADNSKADIYFPGIVLGGKLGPLNVTVEGVGQFGDIENLSAANFGFSKMNFQSFAAFGEVSLDLTAQGIGLTPFVNVDYRSGDDNPFDDELKGYVAISDLSSALRKDGAKFQSISSLGPPTLGAGGEAAWGFNTGGRGTGPTIGSIIDDISLGSSVFFNNRFGKADNPGLIKISGGVLGKITPQVDMKASVSYLRFDTTEPIRAEAAINRLSRGITDGSVGVGGCAGVSAVGGPRSDRVKCVVDNLEVDHDMGIEVNFNIGWSPVPAFRIQPFASFFIPLHGADDINGLFLGSTPVVKGQEAGKETRAAYIAGIEFRAQF
ncbi:MAG: hypothetical protein HY574_11850 [candidate division NC10 bacterium]|nr:hypothetical protein [candidate division NC10 bacterium]